eukprot:10392091-Heterocapsa_arctica.AAC.1
MAHQRKYKEQYEPYWDGNDTGGTKLGGFMEYVTHMTMPGKWGGDGEIAAAARHYDIKIVVVPELAESPIYQFHEKATVAIYLWYNGSHYDWMQPEEVDVGTLLVNVAKGKGYGNRGGGNEAERVVPGGASGDEDGAARTSSTG